VGYFVFANRSIALELALQAGLQTSSSETDGKAGASSSAWQAGLDIPLYFKALKKHRIFPFLHAAVLMKSVTTRLDPDQDPAEQSGLDLRLGAGGTLALGAKSGGFMKLSIDYVIRNDLLDKDQNGQDISGLEAGLGFGLFF
jgi:hypothetical protein